MVNTSPSGARRAGWSAEAAAAPAAAMGAAGPTRPAFVGSTYRRAVSPFFLSLWVDDTNSVVTRSGAVRRRVVREATS